VFTPFRCPHPDCRAHRHPCSGFFVRDGYYRPLCRSHPVPRFRCRLCGRGFSRQTFRADRRQKKPFLNAACLDLMVACVGLRQAARVLRVARRTVERRFAWLARHAADFHANHLATAHLDGSFQLDELETFEANRYQPLTAAVLIERSSLFIVATAVGPLRRKGRLTPLQRRRRTEHEARHGRRPSESRLAVEAVLSRLRQVAPPTVVLESDEKPLYGQLGRRLLGPRFAWRTHSASARRDRRNPLFPINHTNARLRHFLSRLRRRTWCVSKKRDGLQAHLHIAMLWSNFCRGITNRTRTTPAQAVGVVPLRYRPEEVLAWRQDWGLLSPALLA
jgi:transposase-like protein